MGEHPVINTIRGLVREHFRKASNKILNVSEMVYNNIPHETGISSWQVAKTIAEEFRETGRFEIETSGLTDSATYFLKVVEKKHWSQKNPVVFAISMAFIGAAFAVMGELVISKTKEKELRQQDTQQDKRLDSLMLQLTNYQKMLSDSIASLRADSFLKNR